MESNTPQPLQYIDGSLHELLVRGDLRQLMASLQPSDTNAFTYLGLPILSQSILYGHTDLVHFLLLKGADPNGLSESGDFPLHYAADSSTATISKLLLNSGAEVNALTSESLTALHISAKKADLHNILILLYHRADPNVPSKKSGRTPVHLAVEANCKECVVALLKYGGDPHLPDREGRTPRSLASSSMMRCIDNNERRMLTTVEEEEDEYLDSTHEPESEKSNVKKEGALFEFLRGIGLEFYFESLVNNGFDDIYSLIEQMNSPMPLSQNMLQACGIVKPGHQKRILLQFRRRRRTEFIGDDLIEWLRRMGLGFLYENFVDAGYDELAFVVELMHSEFPITEEVLETEIKIEKRNNRLKILNALDHYAREIKGSCQECTLL